MTAARPFDGQVAAGGEPRVTVLMSVFNGMPFLPRSIESVLAQSLRDFEFLIVDDGSNDATAEVLERYAARDARIRVLRQAANRGLVASLNWGLEETRGDWVARQDADSLSLPERLARQVAYLRDHPRVGVLGTWLDLVDLEGRRVDRFRPPTSPSLIEWDLLFRCSLGHPSVMVRAGLLREHGYRAQALHAEDYDLWVRLLHRAELANLPEVLVQEHFHPGKITLRYPEIQERTVHAVQREYLSLVLGHPLPLARAQLHRRLSEQAWAGVRQREIVDQARLLNRLRRRFLRRQGTRLSPEEREALARDVGGRLMALAASGAPMTALARARIAWRGARVAVAVPEFVALRELATRCLPGWFLRRWRAWRGHPETRLG